MNHKKIQLFFRSITNLIDLIWSGDWGRVDCLFICASVDRTLLADGRLYSRILDPIGYFLKIKDYKIKHISWDFDRRKYYFKYKYIGLVTRSHTFSFLFLKYICCPKVIVAIGWTEAFLSAAKLLKIPTVEPLHGFGLDADTLLYGTNNKIKLTPETFIAYDDQSFQTLNNNIFKNFSVKRCSHPYIENFFFNKDSRRFYGDLIDRLKGDYSKLGLITLQHGYEGSRDFLKNILPNGLIHESLVNTIYAQTEIFWIVRAHPVQFARGDWLETLASLQKLFKSHPNIDVDSFHTVDIVEVISRVDIHITMMSGAIEECALFDIPTVALCPTLANGGLMQNAFLSARTKGLLYLSDLSETAIADMLSKAMQDWEKSKSNTKFFETNMSMVKSSDVISQVISMRSSDVSGELST